MKRETLHRILRARDARRPAVLLTWLDEQRQVFVDPDDTSAVEALDDALREPMALASKRDRATTVESEGQAVFVQPINPPLRMLIIGAVHIGQYLSIMATTSGYDVTVVDPRVHFATAERFRGIALSHAWPDKALAELRPDRRTAVITLTHDPKLDDPALIAVLESSAFYIGCLGSRRTHEQRMTRLRQAGVSEAALDRIHGPVGLDIGARSPAEIAVSILAEVTQSLRVVA